MPADYETIRAGLDSLPVIDAHEHLLGHSQCIPQAGAITFLGQCYLASMLRFADGKLAEQVQDEALPEEDRWQALVALWPALRASGFGQIVGRILKNWGIDDDLRVDTLPAIQAKLKARTPEMSKKAFAEKNIRAALTHYLGHPCIGGLPNIRDFFDNKLSFEPPFYPLLGTLPLHQFTCKADLQEVEKVANVSITSLETAMAAVEEIFTRAVKKGIVGIKDHSACLRGLFVGPPDRPKAEKELTGLLQGKGDGAYALCLSDFLLHYLACLAESHSLPMAMHTGGRVACCETKQNVLAFSSFFEAHPNLRFDLYHLNYPWLEDMIAVMRRFPNLWANCTWTTTIDPAATIRFLEQSIGAIPANRVFGFGGDYLNTPEPVVAHLEMAKDQIAEALGNAVARKWVSKSTALDIAEMWLYRNPKELYDLPV